MVKVQIRVKEEVIYYQTREITQEQYDNLIKLDGEDVANFDQNYWKIEEVLDKDDVFDNGGEFLEFEISKEE